LSDLPVLSNVETRRLLIAKKNVAYSEANLLHSHIPNTEEDP
jgi:hypothetical protein